MGSARSILGLVTGFLLILSAAAHALLGWKQLRSELEPLHPAAELVRAIGVGWNFGGVAMLAFGCIVVALFTQRLKGVAVSLLPAIIIGATYVAFGAGALVVSEFNPHFLVFVIPGVLLLIASVSRRAS